MAGLRLTAAVRDAAVRHAAVRVRRRAAGFAMLALAACSSARADAGAGGTAGVGSATSGLRAPGGWSALPAMAQRVGAAATGEGVAVEGVEAWGDPGTGCFATWFALRGGDGNLLAVDDALASLADQKIATSAVVEPPGGDGLVSLAFTRAPFAGQLRARIDGGRLVAVACFALDRGAAACAAPCATLLGGIA